MFSDQIIQQLFHEESLNSVPLEKLEELSEQYPYFAQGQLMLAQKKQENAELQEVEWQRLQLYISNPFVLQQLKTPANELVIDDNVEEEDQLIEISTEEKLAEDALLPQNEIEETAEESTEDALTNNDLPSEERKEIHSTAAADSEAVKEETELNPAGLEENGQPVDLVQPLFTTDYFAHQGIHLPDEVDDSKPPTSSQLRSFTDWLRTTKRPKGTINPNEAALPTEVAAQDNYPEIPESIKKMVSNSNQQEKIVTEAMADIRARQGQIEQAVEIYEKLSLQNPEKSSYFAEKIAAIQASN